MKRLLLLAGAGALCTLALFAVYCTQVDLNNPIDKKAVDEGTADGWLWNEDACIGLSDGYGGTLGKGCDKYMRDKYGDPTFDQSIIEEWKSKLSECDESQDKITIKLEGPKSVTLKHNHPNSDSTTGGFQKWMGEGGQWTNVVSFTGGPNVVQAVLFQGAAPYSDQTKTKMPPDGTYFIRYFAKKAKCRDKTDSTIVSEDRTLVVDTYKVDDRDPPAITFTCDTVPIAAAGQSSYAFNDASCASANAGSTLTRTPGTHGVPLNISVPGTQRVTYKAYKDITENDVTRKDSITLVKNITVKAAEIIGGNDPIPVIVLNNYTYNIGGKQFRSPDTAFGDGGRFVDKGVAEAYYMKDGAKENIPVGLVEVTEPAYTTADGGNNVRYVLKAASGYAEGSVNRVVYILENCESAPTPSFTFLPLSGTGSIGGDSTLTIPKNTPWGDPKRSFRARETDTDGTIFNSYKFGIDFGTLDPGNPQSGTYKISYIALSKCPGSAGASRFFRSVERTVVVSP